MNNTAPEVLILLRHGTVGLVLRTPAFNQTDEDRAYYYNEHTCPTNFLAGPLSTVVGVIDLDTGNPDPHGIFEFVKSVPLTEESKALLEQDELQPIFGSEAGPSIDGAPEITKTDIL